MAEEQFNITYIDNTGTGRNILIRIDDDLALARINEYINAPGSDYQLDQINRLESVSLSANLPGQAKASYYAKYLDNNGDEIEQIRTNYVEVLPQDFNENTPMWTKKDQNGSAINKMLTRLFKSKDVLVVDANQKPIYPFQFVHPCWADISFTEDTGASDGTITVRPRAGTADFDVMINNNATWIPIVGLTYTFTGLPGAASAHTTPYRIDVRDSSTPVQRTKPVDNILL